MKLNRIFTVAAAFCLLGSGCSTAIPKLQEETESDFSPLMQISLLEQMSEEDEKWIKMNIDGGTMPSPVPASSEWKLPSMIVSPQVKYAYRLTDGTYFAFVMRGGNMNTTLMNTDGTLYYGPTEFGGVMFTMDDGKTWKEIIEAPTSEDQSGHVRYIPVGMSSEKVKGKTSFVIDFQNDRGAGSGEGIMLRYRSYDGISWKRDPSCYYMTPEAYYYAEEEIAVEPGALRLLKTPFALSKESCPVIN